MKGALKQRQMTDFVSLSITSIHFIYCQQFLDQLKYDS